MRISDWSSDVCSSDLLAGLFLYAETAGMIWRRKKTTERRAPKSLRRSFVTPEGVDLQLDLGGAGERAGAFLVDLMLILAILIGGTLLLWLIFGNIEQSGASAVATLWLLGFFLLRNGWRSAERRVGTECVSTSNSRWAP